MRNKLLAFLLCILFLSTITKLANAELSAFVQNDFLTWEELLPSGKVTESGTLWKGGIRYSHTFKSINFTIFTSLLGGHGKTEYKGYIATLSASIINKISSYETDVNRVTVQLDIGGKKEIYRKKNFKGGIKGVVEGIVVSRELPDYTITATDTFGSPIEIRLSGPWEVWSIINLKGGIYGDYRFARDFVLISEAGINYPIKTSVDVSEQAYNFTTGEILNLENTLKPDGKIGFYVGLGIKWSAENSGGLGLFLNYDVRRFDWSKYYHTSGVVTNYKLLFLRLDCTF